MRRRNSKRVETNEIEHWALTPEFPNYEVSDMGNIRSIKSDKNMRTSLTPFGHVKISLMSDFDGFRYTRSVARLVAEAFVDKPNLMCDQVVVLDGNFENVKAENLVWRPRWYAWKYTRQLKMAQPLHYRNLPVVNRVTGAKYSSIIVAGMTEGLLFDEIWRSTYSDHRIFPNGHVFEVIEYRV